MKRSRTVFEERSALSGRVRVVDYRRERQLIVAGDTLSVYPLNGDWSRMRREYWWRALEVVPIPRRPVALLVGLGGGTQVHLLRQRARAQRITVIERDPVILRVAEDWFGLREVPDLEYLCGDAEVVAAWLGAAGRRFDFIMEDAAYAGEPVRSQALARALVPLVAPHGVLVINRHRRGDARDLAREFQRQFRRVQVRRVRRHAENVLLGCADPYAAGKRL